MRRWRSEKNGGLIRELRASEWQLQDGLAWLEQRARALNLKLRGVPDSMEINRNLQHNITAWLTPLLRLEGNVSPTISAVYRIGPVSSIHPNFPRDIILQFVYAKERDAVLCLARGSGSLSYSASKIMDILLKR